MTIKIIGNMKRRSGSTLIADALPIHNMFFESDMDRTLLVFTVLSEGEDGAYFRKAAFVEFRIISKIG